MHAQFTLQQPRPANRHRSAVPGQAGPREDDGPVLRFGFTYQHLEALARRGVGSNFAPRGRNWDDLYEAAWGAAVECLYAAPESEPPNSLDLLKASARELKRLGWTSMRDRGYTWNRSGGGTSAATSFWSYWTSPGLASPEETAVDRTALAQIMSRLAPVEAEALHALAEHGGHRAAAEALGLPSSTFNWRLKRARTAFLALWHEHETPSRPQRDSPEFARVLHGQPATRAEAAEAMAAVAEAFGGRTRIPGRDLLAALAAADPGRYGDWNRVDLACFLRRHGVPRHTVKDCSSLGKDGRGRSVSGYWLEEVTAALADLAAEAVPGRQAAA